MIKRILLMIMFFISAASFAEAPVNKPVLTHYQLLIDKIRPYFSLKPLSTLSMYRIKGLLENKDVHLNPAVINKVMASLECTKEYNIDLDPILVVLDFSLPSSQKRLWVFDLNENKLLFHTYVSHGITSGALASESFSNKRNSKASSIGVFRTAKAYYGRHGLSLRLEGLDRSFNDNALSRYVVMHGSWYMNENFIKRYGRPGRSWGCPSVPLELTKPIIDTIKENALFVAYYPNEDWLSKSKFLNCKGTDAIKYSDKPKESKDLMSETGNRDEILFADMNKNDRREEHEPIVVMSAGHYEEMFSNKVPLKRMLRRQINKEEYIALSYKELQEVLNRDRQTLQPEKHLEKVHFVIPEVKKQRGYYATEMKFVDLGKVEEIQPQAGSSDDDQAQTYTLSLQSKPDIIIKGSKRFIRWLGL